MYGCHNLQRGDRDGDASKNILPKWGGIPGAQSTLCKTTPVANTVVTTTPNPVNIPQHVQALQEDLRSLGFAGIGTPDGDFGLGTYWAVREFQIYASMAQVAQVNSAAEAELLQGAHLVTAMGAAEGSTDSRYVSSLVKYANTGAGKYSGPISGVVNQKTRDCITFWLENRLRCPVIIEAWTVKSGKRATLLASNLWKHNQLESTKPRMFARDFSSYYTFPTGKSADEIQVIGDFASFPADSTFNGPQSLPPNHTWTEAEMLPEPLTGAANPTGATLSTYRVVRSVSEVECMGQFDSVNCYDNAFVSVGPCHWTLGIVDTKSRKVSEGEMCGFLAYLRYANEADFKLCFENFGARIDENWTVQKAGPKKGEHSGGDLYSSSQRKYTGWVALKNEAGDFVRLPMDNKLGEKEGNYFKSWHWHYRFVMAGRCIAGYQAAMWGMARIRLRDILKNTNWGDGVASVITEAATAASPGQAAKPAKTRPSTIMDVFTSEYAVAMILRWHIRYPAHVISSGAPGGKLRAVLTAAKAAANTLDWTTDPTTWTDEHETALVTAFQASPPSGVKDAFTYLGNWPAHLEKGKNSRGYKLAAPIAAALDRGRGSFKFDDAGLPPAP